MSAQSKKIGQKYKTKIPKQIHRKKSKTQTQQKNEQSISLDSFSKDKCLL